jgi:hypothetical protein
MAIKITGTTVIDDNRNITTDIGTIDGRDVAADGAKLDGISAGATGDQTKADIDALNIDADTLDGQHGSYYTGYTDTAISNLVDSSPATLDTLNELAAALGDDPNFATTVATNISTKVSKSGDTMTGNFTVPNLGIGTTSITDSSWGTGNAELAIEGGSKYGVIHLRGTGAGSVATRYSIGVGDSKFYMAYDDVDGVHRATINSSHQLILNEGSGDQRAFHDGYHPNADKWTTARTLSLSGDASGSVSWDGSANATLNVTVANDSHTHDGRYYTETEADSRFVNVTGDTMTGDLLVQDDIKSTGQVRATGWWNTNTGTSGNDLAVEMGISGGAGYILTYDRNASSYGSLNFNATSFSFDQRPVFSGNTAFDDGYHPNADKWTTARTLSLSGDASGSVSWDGSANATLSVAVANDSHTHSQLIAVDDRDMKPNTSGIGSGVKGIKAFFSSYGGMTGTADTDYQDVLVLDTYSDGSGGNANAITLDKSSSAMRIWNAAQGATSWGTPQRVFADNYHPNADKWTTARSLSLSGDASGSVSWDGSANATLSVTVANDSHSHSNYITSNANDTGTGSYSTTGTYWEVKGDGGSVAMTTNDGYGNANLTFNHRSGVPDKTGSASRIESGVDSTSGHLTFEVGNSVTAGTAVNLTEVLKLTTGGATILGNTAWHAGNDGSGSGLDADTVDGIQASSFLRSDANDIASGSYSFTNSYNEFGNSTGNVSNDGSWNARLNLAGSSHARLDVTSVSDGIITTMYSHTGQGAGKVGTYSNHPLVLMTNGASSATLSTSGSLSTTTQGTLWGSSNDGAGSGLDADLLDGLNSSSFLRSDTDDNLTAAIIVPTANRDEGIFGTYDSYKTQHIWSMGTSYRNASNGANFGNMYGLSYYHPNNGTNGSMASSHQTVHCINGSPKVALGTNIWTSGSIIVGGTVDGRDVAADGTKLDTIATNANNYSLPATPSVTGIYIGSQVQLAESGDRADLLQISSNTTGWAGLQIRNTSNEGRWSFMTDGNTAGIYDDENGDWHILMTENAGLTLYYNGASKFYTTGAGATVDGDLTVSGGDIVLGGTGRIQGVDTVSSGTDAANKNYVDTAVAASGGSLASVYAYV